MMEGIGHIPESILIQWGPVVLICVVVDSQKGAQVVNGFVLERHDLGAVARGLCRSVDDKAQTRAQMSLQYCMSLFQYKEN